MLKILLIALILTVPNLSIAQMAMETGMITKLLVHNAGSDPSGQRIIVALDGDLSNGFCRDQTYWSLLIDTEASKAQYALLLANYLAGKRVKIWGNPFEDCIAGSENIRNVEIVP